MVVRQSRLFEQATEHHRWTHCGAVGGVVAVAVERFSEPRPSEASTMLMAVPRGVAERCERTVDGERVPSSEQGCRALAWWSSSGGAVPVTWVGTALHRSCWASGG